MDINVISTKTKLIFIHSFIYYPCMYAHSFHSKMNYATGVDVADEERGCISPLPPPLLLL